MEEHPELPDLSATRNFFKTSYSEAGFHVEDKGPQGLLVSNAGSQEPTGHKRSRDTGISGRFKSNFLDLKRVRMSAAFAV
jgi:hypothetical protein